MISTELRQKNRIHACKQIRAMFDLTSQEGIEDALHILVSVTGVLIFDLSEKGEHELFVKTFEAKLSHVIKLLVEHYEKPS